MTGDGHGDLVGGAGPGDGPNGGGFADSRRDFGIARGLARRDVAQRLPDTMLKRRAAHIERKREPALWRFDKADDLGDQFFEVGVSADEIGLGKTILEVARQSLGIVAQSILYLETSVAMSALIRAKPTLPI